jgi:hypothetical protein
MNTKKIEALGASIYTIGYLLIINQRKETKRNR